MDHKIVQDLAPSYLDELVSEYTKQKIDEHLVNCRECQNYYREMKAGISVENQFEDTVNQKTIDVFKKVKKVNHRQILVAILTTFLICVVSFSTWYYFFERTWMAKSDDIKVERIQKNNGVNIVVRSKNHKTLLIDGEENNDVSYRVYQTARPSREYSLQSRTLHYNYTEKKHLDGYDQKVRAIKKSDKLTLQFADRTIKIPLKK
jgi:hypothetical protein